MMQTTLIPDSTLDRILAVQLTLAWAGEGRSDPPRLGWWQTDLVDPLGGGDLLARLLPRTQAWASLEAAREAARRVDGRMRDATARPDELRTLFHLGTALDARLSDRLAHHKRSGIPPAKALDELADVETDFDPKALEAALRREVDYRITPAGRELRTPMPDAPDLAVALLAAALLPFADAWPMPFFREAK